MPELCYAAAIFALFRHSYFLAAVFADFHTPLFSFSPLYGLRFRRCRRVCRYAVFAALFGAAAAAQFDAVSSAVFAADDTLYYAEFLRADDDILRRRQPLPIFCRRASPPRY